MLIVIYEVVQLVTLQNSVKSYAEYWQNDREDGDFLYVALGDSAAQGIGASKPQYGYVGLIAEYLNKKTNKRIKVINLSVSGAKIEDVLNNQIPQLKQLKPNLITLDIGANDVANNYNSHTFLANFDALIAQLPKNSVIGNIPYFGGRIRKNSEATDANNHISDLAAKYGLAVADLQTITKNNNGINTYASDFFHPSDKGYINWAEAYWNVISKNIK